MELTWAELARDTEWVTARLREHGLAAGQRALLTASGFEGFWGRAVIGALRALKVTYGIAEAMGWDHRRTAVFHRELNPHAVSACRRRPWRGSAGSGRHRRDVPLDAGRAGPAAAATAACAERACPPP